MVRQIVFTTSGEATSEEQFPRGDNGKLIIAIRAAHVLGNNESDAGTQLNAGSSLITLSSLIRVIFSVITSSLIISCQWSSSCSCLSSRPLCADARGTRPVRSSRAYHLPSCRHSNESAAETAAARAPRRHSRARRSLQLLFHIPQ